MITHVKRCEAPITLCTDQVRVLFGEHEAQVTLVPSGTLLVVLDGVTPHSFPHREAWVAVERPDELHVAIAVPEIHLQVTYSAENYGFLVTVPSQLFFNQTEGLCGQWRLGRK